jgi:hypothetical protein
MDPDTGLESTQIRVREKKDIPAAGMKSLHARWDRENEVPTVHVSWRIGCLFADEYISCPDEKVSMIRREVVITNDGSSVFEGQIQTGLRGESFVRDVTLKAGEIFSRIFSYVLDISRGKIDFIPQVRSSFSEINGLEMAPPAQLISDSSLINHYFYSSMVQMPAVISKGGRMDASIWQYNREWVRDQAMVALGLILSGSFSPARTILHRLCQEFITDEGDAVDSSERRHADEVELDQNGELLYVLKKYVLWTNDWSLIEENWSKISAAAEFPLRSVFCHEPSGLLVNRREYWERHRLHGIQRGMELAHQFFVSLGLSAAADLARHTGRPEQAGRWKNEAARLKKALLFDPAFRMVDERGFIKRRGTGGEAQEYIEPPDSAMLPTGIGLGMEGKHALNPDTSAALPIAMGFIPPDSPIALATLNHMEGLWNQCWTGGGYGRYNATSEADSPGPWPFPSLFAARAYLENGNMEKAWRVLRWLDSLSGSAAGSWFEFYGQRISPPYPQVGICPWTWAEMILFLVHHMVGLQPHSDHIRIRPRLLSGLRRIQACFPLRNKRIWLNFRADPNAGEGRFQSSARILKASPEELIIEEGKEEIWIDWFFDPAASAAQEG